MFFRFSSFGEHFSRFETTFWKCSRIFKKLNHISSTNGWKLYLWTNNGVELALRKQRFLSTLRREFENIPVFWKQKTLPSAIERCQLDCFEVVRDKHNGIQRGQHVSSSILLVWKRNVCEVHSGTKIDRIYSNSEFWVRKGSGLCRFWTRRTTVYT